MIKPGSSGGDSSAEGVITNVLIAVIGDLISGGSSD